MSIAHRLDLVAALLVMVGATSAHASCPATLTDCPTVNAKDGNFGGKLNSTIASTAPSLSDGWAWHVANPLNYPLSGAWSDRDWTSTATLTANTKGIWQPNFWHCNSNGSFAQQAESNCGHFESNYGAGMTITSTVETLEVSMNNNAVFSGPSGIWIGVLSQISSNSATGTIGFAAAFSSRYKNDNTTANSISVWAGFNCDGPFAGSGSAPQYPFCLRNADPASLIWTAGDIQIRGQGVDQGIPLLVNGKGNTGGTFSFAVKNADGANAFSIDDALDVMAPGRIAVGTPNTNIGVTMFVKGKDTSAGTTSFAVQNSAGTALFSVANNGDLWAGATVGATCASGAPTASFAVTHGIVTHC